MKNKVQNFLIIGVIIYVIISLLIITILFINPDKDPPKELIQFDNTRIEGKIIEFNYGAGSYFIQTNDHEGKEFIFSYLPDGNLPTLGSIISIGDSLIKGKNSDFILIKKQNGKEYNYRLNRIMIE